MFLIAALLIVKDQTSVLLTFILLYLFLYFISFYFSQISKNRSVLRLVLLFDFGSLHN